MPSTTFDYSAAALAHMQAANDYVNGQTPDEPPVGLKERLATLLRTWVVQALYEKQREVAEEEQAALTATISGEVDIT